MRTEWQTRDEHLHKDLDLRRNRNRRGKDERGKKTHQRAAPYLEITGQLETLCADLSESALRQGWDQLRVAARPKSGDSSSLKRVVRVVQSLAVRTKMENKSREILYLGIGSLETLTQSSRQRQTTPLFADIHVQATSSGQSPAIDAPEIYGHDNRAVSIIGSGRSKDEEIWRHGVVGICQSKFLGCVHFFFSRSKEKSVLRSKKGEEFRERKKNRMQRSGFLPINLCYRLGLAPILLLIPNHLATKVRMCKASTRQSGQTSRMCRGTTITGFRLPRVRVIARVQNENTEGIKKSWFAKRVACTSVKSGQNPTKFTSDTAHRWGIQISSCRTGASPAPDQHMSAPERKVAPSQPHMGRGQGQGRAMRPGPWPWARKGDVSRTSMASWGVPSPGKGRDGEEDEKCTLRLHGRARDGAGGQHICRLSQGAPAPASAVRLGGRDKSALATPTGAKTGSRCHADAVWTLGVSRTLF
ncbi:hypothetical protein DFH07DRAFT_785621 [Mycena maculata]|uniref:Uncharacterized protein n=1 Tax=Mycena maculata TaxID=230809 RepID=A0AAD7H8Z5_9AGAR|nr:hypothetical protein DFH07DRAFT_785621 [Mycena maculata]